jgi:hypothetical protein
MFSSTFHKLGLRGGLRRGFKGVVVVAVAVAVVVVVVVATP